MAKLKEKKKSAPKPQPQPTSPPVSGTTPATTDERKAFVDCARSKLGSRYVWGTAGPNTFDCSGLVAWCYQQVTGKSITRSSYDQLKLGSKVDIEDLQPGDLVFWDTERNGTAGHVGIFAGNGKVINAMNPSTGVVETNLTGQYGGPYIGGRRLDFKGDSQAPTTPKVGNVTRDTNFREAGNTDYESFRGALSRTVEAGLTPPPLAEARAIFDILEPHGLTRIAAGMAWIERSNETYRPGWSQYYGPELHNLWAVKNANGTWAHYPNYAEAAKAWHTRILGPTYADVKSIAQFIAKYAPWSDGNNPDEYGNKLVSQINALPFRESPTTPTPQPPTTPTGPKLKTWTIPGLGTIGLPDYITVETVLSPVGVHRPGRKVTMTGSTWHETGNRGQGSGARMHSNWQDGCTQGHPDGYVGVHAYVENRLVIVKIPLNENAIHSGDWRNNAHPSMEVCVNADRNAEQTEDTAMWWQAAIMKARGHEPYENMYPHTKTGCPAIRNAKGQWPLAEKGVQERQAILAGGGAIPAPPTYVDAIMIPKPWDGTDYVAENGVRFYALKRVFVTTKVTGAYQTASATSAKVRADLPAGEAFVAEYIVQGDGGMWYVSQYGSRIKAADCNPRMGLLIAGTWMGDMDAETAAAVEPILDDPAKGLSAETAVDDTPVSKAEFMAG